MTTASNECIPLFEDADRITGQPTMNVIGKRFVAPSTGPLSGPGIPTAAQVGASDPVDGGNLSIAHISGAKQLGVSTWDALPTEKVGVITEGVVPVTAGGTIKAGEMVAAGELGKAIAFNASAEGANQVLEAGATNAKVIFRVNEPGKANVWKIIIKVAGNNTPFSTSVAGKVITINLATGAAGEVLTTAKEMVEKVNATTTENLNGIINVALAEGSTGLSKAEALAETAVTGGTANPIEAGLCVIGATANNDAFIKLHC